MGIYIYDIRSRKELFHFLSTIDIAINSFNPSDYPINNALVNRAKILANKYKNIYGNYILPKAQKAISTSDIKKEAKLLYVLCSQFIDELNKNILRSKLMGNTDFEPEDVIDFRFPVSKPKLPKYLSRISLIMTAEVFIAAEKKRIAAGKKAILSPKWQVINAVLKNLIKINNKIIVARNDLYPAMDNFNQFFKDGLELYKDVYTEINFTQRKLSKTRIHNILKFWGIILKSNTIDKRRFTTLRGIVNSENGLVHKAEIIIVKKNILIRTRKNGSFCINKAPVGLSNIIVRKKPYKEQLFEKFPLKPRTTNYLNVKLMY